MNNPSPKGPALIGHAEYDRVERELLEFRKRAFFWYGACGASGDPGPSEPIRKHAQAAVEYAAAQTSAGQFLFDMEAVS